MTADEFRKILDRFLEHLAVADSWIRARCDLDENPTWYDGLDTIWHDLRHEYALMKNAEAADDQKHTGAELAKRWRPVKSQAAIEALERTQAMISSKAEPSCCCGTHGTPDLWCPECKRHPASASPPGTTVKPARPLPPPLWAWTEDVNDECELTKDAERKPDPTTR